jgi:hypothetical protein
MKNLSEIMNFSKNPHYGPIAQKQLQSDLKKPILETRDHP